MEEGQAELRRLLVEKLTGTISTEEEVTINQLIDSDIQVRNEWLRLQAQLTTAKEKGLFKEPDAAAAWENLRPAIQKRGRIRRIVAITVAAAACLAAVVGARVLFSPAGESHAAFFADTQSWPSEGIILQSASGKQLNLSSARGKKLTTDETPLVITDSSLVIGSTQQSDPQWSTLFVPASENYKLILADGSEVWLNSGTRLRFPLGFTGKQREVYVDGEAYFSVAKNARKPFIVHTVKTDITVTGTAFNVNTYDTACITTALVEGGVRTSSPLGTLQLEPGIESVYTPGSFTSRSFDAATSLSWRTGSYSFQEVPLKSLSGILSRWFKTTIQFDNPAMENKIFSGVLFRHQPLQAFLENLQLSDNIHATVVGGVVHFR